MIGFYLIVGTNIGLQVGPFYILKLYVSSEVGKNCTLYVALFNFTLIHPDVFLYHKKPKITAQHSTLTPYNTVLHASVRTNHRQALLVTI